MIGYRVNKVWLYGWRFTAPSICVLVFLFTIIKYEPIEMTKSRPFPQWAEAVGFLMALFSILMIPGCAMFLFLKTKGTPREVGCI